MPKDTYEETAVPELPKQSLPLFGATFVFVHHRVAD